MDVFRPQFNVVRGWPLHGTEALPLDPGTHLGRVAAVGRRGNRFASRAHLMLAPILLISFIAASTGAKVMPTDPRQERINKYSSLAKVKLQKALQSIRSCSTKSLLQRCLLQHAGASPCTGRQQICNALPGAAVTKRIRTMRKTLLLILCKPRAGRLHNCLPG